MPWREASVVDQRREFVTLARAGGNIRELCRRYRISSKTGYKWLVRFSREGPPGLGDRSRRPHHSPRQVGEGWREESCRFEESTRGGEGESCVDGFRISGVGKSLPPAPSRRFCVVGSCWERVAAPRTLSSALKPRPRTTSGRWTSRATSPPSKGAVIPLTVLDDHSRFCTTLQACRNERGDTVKTRLEMTFRRYGLPRRMLMDNGSPWGSDLEHPNTPLTAWLVRLGVQVVHSGPYHPQTVGKDERFHRSLKAEVITRWDLEGYKECQERFDWWRGVYNFERPHDSLELDVPADRYRSSERSFPETLPAIEYGPGDAIRRVQAGGKIYFKNRVFRIGKPFRGQPVALRATTKDGVWDVYFCHQRISKVDIRRPKEQS